MSKDKKNEVAPVDQTGGAKKKATPKATPKASGSKTAAKKTTKQVVKKSTDKKPKKDKKTRYFKLINEKTLKSHGRYTGDTPKQAASKGYTKMVQHYKKSGKKVPPKTTIYLRESTRGGAGRVYGYTAAREKLDEPQTLVIPNDKGEEKKIVYEFRNKIRKEVVPEQVGGASKKSKALKAKKVKAEKKKSKSGTKTAKPKKSAPKSGSKTAKPKKSGSKTAKPKKSGSKTAKPKKSGSKTAKPKK